jgi:hypothetical protein
MEILFDKNATAPLSQYIRRIVTARDEEPASRIIQQLRAARLGKDIIER